MLSSLNKFSGLVIGCLLSWGAYADDEITPIDPATGKVLVRPEDSSMAEDVTSGHPNPKPNPYTLLRYTERYSYLADPSNRRDPFDSVKYIPLSENTPESYLSLGGEVRERYENYHNQGFGVSGPKDNDYGLQRILLHADLHVNDRLRFFAQGISSIQFGGEFKTPLNQNPLDLQQAFADYTFGDPSPNGKRLTVRGGRFSMSYGSSRMIATRAAPNTPLKFDGIQFIASKNGNSKIYAFLTRPVQEERYRPDRASKDQTFGGVYVTKPLNSLLSADLYYLAYRNEQAEYSSVNGIENRHTFGTRLFGKNGNWDYDIEPIIQTGKIAGEDIRAWTIATDVGYTFKKPWNPRLGFKFDIASGDSNANDDKLETFNPLFFKAGYFNDASLLRPANVTDFHVSLQLQPHEEITTTFGSDVIWRTNRNDGIYGTNGSISLPASSESRYVGTTAEAAIQWKANRHLVAALSYVHMFTSGYAENAGGGDVDYVATWISYLW